MPENAPTPTPKKTQTNGLILNGTKKIMSVTSSPVIFFILKF